MRIVIAKVDPPAYRPPPLSRVDSPRLSATPLIEGGRGGSNPKSIFNLIITSYLAKSPGFFQLSH
ncbi:hypothetical protein FXO09_17250 [Microcystis aeruginosa KLA2]|nr:hypothetical protein FXO09_17250 [Microcystis aeruginosa KLA2]